jgi:predicted nucleotidyltransferase
MRLENYSAEKLKGEIRSIIEKHLDISGAKLFFFGSRVTGKGNDRSDIDVGIEGRGEIDRAVMARIKEDLEKLPVLYKIELVDFTAAPASFREVALQKTETII